MKISIIIPVYNAEKYLKRLLDSIEKQTYSDYEVILINDGSTDSSEMILKEYANKNKKIKYYNQENKGPGLARKNGFNKSTGELLFFVDSDDYLVDNNVLKKIYEIYNKNDFDILFFNYYCKINNIEFIKNSFNKKMKDGYIDEKYFDNYYVKGALWEKVFKAKVMKNDFFCDYNNYEDYYTTYKFLNDANKKYFSNEILYYSDRDCVNSLSKNTNIEKMIKTYTLCSEINKFSKYKKATSKLMLDCYTMIGRYIIKCTNINNKYKYLVELDNIKNINNFNIIDTNFKNIIKIIYIKLYKKIFWRKKNEEK